jgi:hypothetical protein
LRLALGQAEEGVDGLEDLLRTLEEVLALYWIVVQWKVASDAQPPRRSTR